LGSNDFFQHGRHHAISAFIHIELYDVKVCLVSSIVVHVRICCFVYVIVRSCNLCCTLRCVTEDSSLRLEYIREMITIVGNEDLASGQLEAGLVRLASGLLQLARAMCFARGVPAVEPREHRDFEAIIEGLVLNLQLSDLLCSSQVNRVYSNAMDWTLYMFSAILHDCPKQAVQDLSCSKAALVRSLVRNRRRSPIGSFLTATISLSSSRSCRIVGIIASFGRLCTLFLSFFSVGDADGEFGALNRGAKEFRRCRRKGGRDWSPCRAQRRGRRSWRRR
jgi:hypothetical protein